MSLHVLVAPKHHALQHGWVRSMRKLPAALKRRIAWLDKVAPEVRDRWNGSDFRFRYYTERDYSTLRTVEVIHAKIVAALAAYVATIAPLVRTHRMPIDWTTRHALAGIVWLAIAAVLGVTAWMRRRKK